MHKLEQGGILISNYREIVTKAVVAKGKKSFVTEHNVSLDRNLSTILGCWVINHNFSGKKVNNDIIIEGDYDVNIWYSYENDSKTTVINKKITYSDLFNVSIKENADLSSDIDVIVRSLKQPNCTKVNIEDSKINFVIEKELGVELVGETKVKIAIEEDEDEWEEIVDIDETLKDIDKVDENYIEDNKEQINKLYLSFLLK